MPLRLRHAGPAVRLTPRTLGRQISQPGGCALPPPGAAVKRYISVDEARHCHVPCPTTVATAVLLFLPAWILVSCGVPDDREAKARASFIERVTSESKGLLSVEHFAKTNGYDRETDGTKIYVLEWEGRLSAQRQVWKAGNAVAGHWQTFAVFTQEPGTLDRLALGGTTRFYAGAKIRLTGQCRFRKTDNGWRVEQFTVAASEVVPDERFKILVSRDRADFTFPVDIRPRYEWCPGNKLPYSWQARVRNAGRVYAVAWNLFQANGEPCGAGDFEALLKAGQFSVWEENGDSNSLRQDIPVEGFANASTRILTLRVNGNQGVATLFSGRANTVVMESESEDGPFSQETKVTYQ